MKFRQKKIQVELATTPAFESEAESIRRELEDLGAAALAACQAS